MMWSAPGRLRIVVTEPLLARALRDAGHEVVFIGADHTPEQVVAAAIQEDVDMICPTAEVDDTFAASLVALLEASGPHDISVAALTPDQVLAAR